MKSSYDVIVVGGGTAGVVAAMQTGRAGAATLLVEKSGILGGTITTGGINAPAHFFAWGRPIIAGIGWELVRRTLEETGAEVPTPEFTRDSATPKHLRVDKAVFAALCDQAVLDAGAMAALSARTGLDPEELPLADLFALLRAHDAIVPSDES